VRYTKQNLASSSPERILQAQRDFERLLDQATTSTVSGVMQPVNFGLTGSGTQAENRGITRDFADTFGIA